MEFQDDDTSVALHMDDMRWLEDCGAEVEPLRLVIGAVADRASIWLPRLTWNGPHRRASRGVVAMWCSGGRCASVVSFEGEVTAEFWSPSGPSIDDATIDGPLPESVIAEIAVIASARQDACSSHAARPATDMWCDHCMRSSGCEAEGCPGRREYEAVSFERWASDVRP